MLAYKGQVVLRLVVPALSFTVKDDSELKRLVGLFASDQKGPVNLAKAFGR